MLEEVDALLHPVAQWLLESAPHIPSNDALCARDEPFLSEKWTCDVRKPLPVEMRAAPPTDQYYATWFTSPHQLVLEIILMFALMVPPMCYGCFRIFGKLKHQATYGGIWTMGKLEKLWGASLLVTVAYQIYSKATAQDIGQHWAYLAQPCHIHTLLLGLTVFSDSLFSRVLLHLSVTLWWGPMLALVAPEAPTDAFQEFMFFFQHWLMMGCIVIRLRAGCSWMYDDFWMNYLGYMWLLFAHYWVITPVALISGVNVATMTHPPASIAWFGRCYRILWTLCCLLLHFMSVTSLKLLARIFGVRSQPQVNGNGSKHIKRL